MRVEQKTRFKYICFAYSKAVLRFAETSHSKAVPSFREEQKQFVCVKLKVLYKITPRYLRCFCCLNTELLKEIVGD